MELSREEKLKVFALYLGCEVQYPSSEDTSKPIKATLTGVTYTEIETTYKRKKNRSIGDYLSWESNDYHNCDAPHTQLILSPLEDISDEDAIHIAKIANKRLTQREDQIIVGREIAMNVTSVFIEEPFLNEYVEIIDFLRSRGYHLPYRGVNLFDANLAIRKNKK